MLMLIFVFNLVVPDMLGRSINQELHTLGGKRGGMVCEYITASKDWLCILGYEDWGGRRA